MGLRLDDLLQHLPLDLLDQTADWHDKLLPGHPVKFLTTAMQSEISRIGWSALASAQSAARCSEYPLVFNERHPMVTRISLRHTQPGPNCMIAHPDVAAGVP